MFQRIQPKRKNVAGRRVFSHRPNRGRGYQQGEANMIKKHRNSFAPEKKAGNHKWIPVLLLFILMLLSSCTVGYILGRSAFPGPSVRRIDTILLTPDGDAAEPQMQQIFHLTGKINFTNGRPYAHGRVQLHSEPRDTVTDSNGNFSFFHVEGGEHQIRILGSTGNVLGERKVNLFFSAAGIGSQCKPAAGRAVYRRGCRGCQDDGGGNRTG